MAITQISEPEVVSTCDLKKGVPADDPLIIPACSQVPRANVINSKMVIKGFV